MMFAITVVSDAGSVESDLSTFIASVVTELSLVE